MRSPSSGASFSHSSAPFTESVPDTLNVCTMPPLGCTGCIAQHALRFSNLRLVLLSAELKSANTVLCDTKLTPEGHRF